MKQDEVLQTLREVIEEAKNFTTWTVSTPHLVELVKRTVEAEREACCAIVWGLCESDNVAQRTVDAIRARGNT